MSQQAQGDEAEAEEAYQGATQACGCSSDEDEPAVSELRQINAGGDSKVLQLPDGINFKVLAFGREEQAAARGDGARVVSVVLPDARPTGQKKISSLQAEISVGEGGVSFTSLGKTFNFVNKVPLHAMAKKYATSSRIYHDDVLRLGGERDDKPGGGLQEHVFRVNAPALGVRPAAEAAVPAAPPAASAEASPVAAPAAMPAADRQQLQRQHTRRRRLQRLRLLSRRRCGARVVVLMCRLQHSGGTRLRWGPRVRRWRRSSPPRTTASTCTCWRGVRRR